MFEQLFFKMILLRLKKVSFVDLVFFGVRDHMFEQLFFKMILLRLKKVSFVDLGLGSRVMTPNSSTNRIF